MAEKTRYTDEELEEFRQIINEKMALDPEQHRHGVDAVGIRQHAGEDGPLHLRGRVFGGLGDGFRGCGYGRSGVPGRFAPGTVRFGLPRSFERIGHGLLRGVRRRRRP